MNTLTAPRVASRQELLIFHDGEEAGPFSPADLREKLEEGQLDPCTPCRARKEREWHDLAFILNTASDPEPVVGETCGIDNRNFAADTSWPAAPDRTPDTLRGLMSALVELNNRHSRHLAAIKWSLTAVAATLLTATALLALHLFG